MASAPPRGRRGPNSGGSMFRTFTRLATLAVARPAAGSTRTMISREPTELRPNWILAATGVGVGVFLGLYAVLAAYTHYVFEGDYSGPLLISNMFGVPKAATENGVRPVYGSTDSGWDGQFYFHIANDPLGLADTAKHVDNVPYRYQRIGVPALSWAVSRASGHDFTWP